MESSRLNINEIVIENKHCDIFPNQVSMEEVFLTKNMERIKSLQTQSIVI
jgi:hypothetical protein